LLDEIDRRVGESLLDGFNSQNLANVVWSLGRLGVDHGAALNHVCDEVVRRGLDGFDLVV